MTLRRRLLLLMVAVLLPTAGLFAWIVVATYQRELETERQHLRETTHALALVVDRELDKRAVVAHTLAITSGLMEGDHRRFYSEAKAATEGTGNWVVLVDDENQLVNTRVPFGTPLPRRNSRPGQPLATDVPVASNLRIGPLTQEPVLAVFAPVPNVTPAHFNVGVAFTPAALQSILTEQRLPAGWSAAILDQEHNIVARVPNPERWLGKPALPELTAAMKSGTEGFIDLTAREGIQVRAFYSQSPLYGWAFVIGVPQTQLTATARRAAWTSGVAAAVLSMFAIALAAWSAGRIRRPIEALETAAHELAHDRVPRIATTGLAEADAVGAALYRAGLQSAQINEELERRVAAALAAARAAQARSDELQRVLAEELLHLITDNLPVLISYADAQGRYRLNNKAYEAWFERPRTEITGRHVGEVLGESGWQQLRPHFEAALAGEPQHFETRLDYPSGTRWVELHYIPHRPRGVVEGVAILVHDISERRQAHEELQRSETELRESRNVLSLAMRGGRMGAWSRELGTERVWWSRELEEIFGLAPGAFGGTTEAFRELVHPDDGLAVAQTIDQALREHADYAVEFRFRHASGEWHWMEGRGRAFYDDAGRPTMVYGLGIDITARKRSEDELLRLNAELADAARRKDEFLATLAHELRNPLAPITNALEVLRLKNPSDPDMRWTRDVIDRQVRQMTRLVDDLLDVARITRGRIELRRERIDAAALVHGAVEAAKPLIAAAGHRLTVDLPPEPLWLDADPTRLTQVLLNLLNNAAKYTPAGGRLSVQVHREGDEAVLAVSDSGIGLAPEHQQSVFEMFSQVVPALERSQGGLGIGLALARGLVELHGGSIAARSAGTGMGSTFIVRLPLAAPVGAEAGGPDRAAQAQAPSLRVLVVDDNRDAADSLAMILQINGHEVTVAHDGPGALALAEEFHPHLGLLDIGMPGMNGYELARRLRAMPHGQHMVLAALTGWGQQEDKRRAIEAGFDHHLTKPVDPAHLDAVLLACSAHVGASA